MAGAHAVSFIGPSESAVLIITGRPSKNSLNGPNCT
jgi:hypothetical protein